MYIRYTSWVTHAIKCITITVFKHLLMFQQHAPEFHYPHFIITNAFVCLHVSSINVTLETCLTLRVYLQNPNSLLFPLFPKNKSTSSRFSVTFGYCERYITVNDSGIMISICDVLHISLLNDFHNWHQHGSIGNIGVGFIFKWDTCLNIQRHLLT